jgi:phosphoglycolate phosphatase
MKPQLSALLFDLDGTLIDSAPDLRQAINTVLTHENLPVLTLEQAKLCLGDGLKKMLVKAFGLAGHPANEQDMQRLMPIFAEVYKSITPKPSCIFEGAREFLEAQAAQGIKLGLCTNKYEEATHRLLKQLDLARYFDVVVGGDTLPKLKPDPLPLQHALQVLKCDPANAIMIGDHANDVLAAHGAGMKVIGADYGYTHGWTDDAMPDARANVVSEFPSLLARLYA